MRSNSLTVKILIGMIVGLALGVVFNWMNFDQDALLQVLLIDGLFDIGGKLFIASLKLLVVPLVFVSLACGAIILKCRTIADPTISPSATSDNT